MPTQADTEKGRPTEETMTRDHETGGWTLRDASLKLRYAVDEAEYRGMRWRFWRRSWLLTARRARGW